VKRSFTERYDITIMAEMGETKRDMKRKAKISVRNNPFHLGGKSQQYLPDSQNIKKEKTHDSKRKTG